MNPVRKLTQLEETGMQKEAKKYDYILIGSGQGNNPLAQVLAQNGKQVVLIERNKVGGSCINWGCTPTKTMAASALVAWYTQNAADWGIEASQVRVNFEAVMHRKDKLVNEFRESSQKGLEKLENIDLLFGEASFAGEKTVKVISDNDEQLLTAPCIVINTGSRSVVPDIEGVSVLEPLTARRLMELKELPEQLLILGGSYLGLEFGQMFSRFGSEVCVLEKGQQLAGKEDEDIAACLQEILQEEGIKIILDAKASRIDRNNDRYVLYYTDAEGKTQQQAFTHLLLGTGRQPNTDNLLLHKAGIAQDDKGYIKVNDKLETNIKGIYAIGDVTGGPAFTHIAYDDFRIVKDQLLGERKKNKKDRLVPYTLFTEPQLGRVGITEQQAKQQGLDYELFSMEAKKAARAIETGRSKGLIKVLADKNSKQILGVAALCMNGGELMGVLQAAMLGKLPYTELRDSPFAHPTLTESLNNLFS